MSTKLVVPGDIAVADTLDVTGETIARSGVRLTTPSSGPLLLSDSDNPNGVLPAAQGSVYARTAVPELYQNINGATAWSKVGGAAFAGAAYYASGTQSVTGGAYDVYPGGVGAWNALTYDTADYDVGGFWSVVEPTRFVAPTAGYYNVTAGVSVNIVTGQQVMLGLGKNVPSAGINSTLDVYAYLFRIRTNSMPALSPPVSGVYPITTVSGVVSLAAGDWVGAFVLVWSGGGTYDAVKSASNRFTISKVG